MTTATERDYDNPNRPLPEGNWTPLDHAQNFAEAALGQAQRFAREVADRDEDDQYWEGYYAGAKWYAQMILNYIKNTGIDEDKKEN